MQLTNTPGKLVLPFANAGAKNTIPTASQIGITAGAASLTDGFPPLTRTPIAAGGVPPSGLDMNGILFQLSAILRWANAGGGYAYDSTFANDSNVNGYPKGARVMRSDGLGYWFNTVENNTTDPEAAGAAAAGWVPDFTNGVTSVAMASTNVTLTPLQYGKPIIVITGTLTANLNLIFPAIVNEWTVINNTTGPYTITCKTAAGTGIVVNTAALIVGDGTNIQSAVTDVTGGVQTNQNNTFTKAQRGALVTWTSHNAGTYTPDFSQSNNYQVVLYGNRTLAVPTNLVAGQSGVIDIFQDATGSRTLALAWGWSPPGGTAPALSTAPLTRDQWAYYVGTASQSVATISIATPGVVTWNGHGLKGGEKIQFTTTGALPTGLTASTTYYVKPVDANTFQLSTTLGGAAISTSGTQSGVHTAQAVSITINQLKAVP